MHRKAKLNIDYKILHTSGKIVIKNNMTNKLIQDDLDVILDIDEYIEDHNPHHLEHLLEVENVISEFKTLFEKFKGCQS